MSEIVIAAALVVIVWMIRRANFRVKAGLTSVEIVVKQTKGTSSVDQPKQGKRPKKSGESLRKADR